MSFNLINYNIPSVKYLYRTDKNIKNDFSTAKLKIDDRFINFIEQFNYLWLDESYQFNYIITPMKNDLLNFDSLTVEDSDVHQALKFNFTQNFIIDNCYRMANNQNIINTIEGDTGSGKSRFSINQLYLVNKFVNEILGIDRDFNINNICFSRSEIIDLVPKMKSCESCQLDEDNEFLLGNGSFQEWSQVNREEKTLRSMSKNFNNLSPELRKHNEHFIFKALGYNDIKQTNKIIIRERENCFKGYVILPNFHDNKYKKLIKDYEEKKKKFQKDLELNQGDDKRIKRLLDMAVNIINEFRLSYKMKDLFNVFIDQKYKVTISDNRDIKRLILILLDERTNVFNEYKKRIIKINNLESEIKK